MKKTLYFDKDTNDILDKMPEKKQSEFVRQAVKHYFYNKDKIVEPVKELQKVTLHL